jgi:hypothetical protein
LLLGSVNAAYPTLYMALEMTSCGKMKKVKRVIVKMMM